MVSVRLFNICQAQELKALGVRVVDNIALEVNAGAGSRAHKVVRRVFVSCELVLVGLRLIGASVLNGRRVFWKRDWRDPNKGHRNERTVSTARGAKAQEYEAEIGLSVHRRVRKDIIALAKKLPYPGTKAKVWDVFQRKAPSPRDRLTVEGSAKILSSFRLFGQDVCFFGGVSAFFQTNLQRCRPNV